MRSKPPDHLNTEDVKGFLTDLTVRQNVAGATQNQAFNALLFFYRHVCAASLGRSMGLCGPKRRPYVPVVLSRGEVEVVNTLGIRRIMFAVDDIEDVLARLRAHGAELIGEVAQYEDMYRLCYIRGPEGIIVALAEQLG